MHYKAPDNSLHSLDSTEYEHLLPAGSVQITDAEAKALHPVAPELTYAELRASAYPSIQDQLDTIFHDGLDAWKVEIQAVKDEFPKP
jgi:hypothetical protein